MPFSTMVLKETLQLTQRSVGRDRDHLGREHLCPHQKTHYRAYSPRITLQAGIRFYHDTAQVSPPNPSIVLPLKDDMS